MTKFNTFEAVIEGKDFHLESDSGNNKHFANCSDWTPVA